MVEIYNTKKQEKGGDELNSEKEIIVIGTVHSSWTPHDELIVLLKEYRPDKLLVELSPEELDSERRKTSIRDEMFAAYDWAQEQGTPVDVFDIENDILREGVTGQESVFKEYEQASKKLLDGYSWKELNKEEPWDNPEIRKLDEKMNTHYVDQERSQRREQELIQSIRKLTTDGKNVVLIGAGHLDALEKQLPGAKFPFRK